MPHQSPHHSVSRFLRDPRLPWLEIRRVQAGNANFCASFVIGHVVQYA